MKHIHFEVKTDGFYGVYWKCKTPVDITIIAMLGNDPEGYMAKEFPKECKQTRVDIDRRVVEVIKDWKRK